MKSVNVLSGAALIVALQAVSSLLLAAPADVRFPSPVRKPLGPLDAVGDFDGDHLDDLIEAGGFLRGLGNGRFAEPVEGALDAVERVAGPPADLDGDGRLDLVVIAGTGPDETAGIRRGVGEGRFAPGEPLPPLGVPLAQVRFAIADVTADGRPDLVVTQAPGSDPGTVAPLLLAGAGDGTFGAPQTITEAAGGAARQVAELTGDGIPDLLVEGPSSGAWRLVASLGGGAFGPGIDLLLATPDLVAGDVTGDGIADLLTPDGPRIDVRVALGGGHFAAAVPTGAILDAAPRAPGAPAFATIADVDGDGRGDVVVPILKMGATPDRAEFPYGSAFLTLRSLGGGNLAAPVRHVLPYSPSRPSLWPASLDSDGRRDLVVRGEGTATAGYLAAYSGQADGTLARLARTPLPAGSGPFTVGWLTFDGCFDIVVASGGTTLTAFLGLCDGRFENSATVTLPAPARKLLIGDVDADGNPDVIAATDTGVLIVPGLGDGRLGPAGAVRDVGPFQDMAGGDFNYDGRYDIVYVTGDRVDGYFGKAGPDFTLATRYFAGLQGRMLSAYLDGDGNSDLLGSSIIGNQPGGPEQLYTMKGTPAAGFTNVQSVGPGFFLGLTGLALGDLDGDRIPDLVVGGGQYYPGPFAYHGRGDRTFVETPFVTAFGGLGVGAGSVAVGDFNGDRKGDLVDAPFDDVFVSQIRLANGDGTFTPPEAYVPDGTIPADLNSDGWDDLVSVQEGWGDTPAEIVVALNFSSRWPTARIATTQTQECTSAAGAEVTLDGSGSTDPDSTPLQSDIIAYGWIEDFGTTRARTLEIGQDPVLRTTLPLGRHVITLYVVDRTGASGRATAEVTVVDTKPPVLSMSLNPTRLSQVGRQLVPIHATVGAFDGCSVPHIALAGITSSDPDDAPGNADGQTTGDIAGAVAGTEDFDFLLRAERTAQKERIYTVVYEAVDAGGNRTTATATVTVPARHAAGRRASRSGP